MNQYAVNILAVMLPMTLSGHSCDRPTAQAEHVRGRPLSEEFVQWQQQPDPNCVIRTSDVSALIAEDDLLSDIAWFARYVIDHVEIRMEPCVKHDAERQLCYVDECPQFIWVSDLERLISSYESDCSAYAHHVLPPPRLLVPGDFPRHFYILGRVHLLTAPVNIGISY